MKERDETVNKWDHWEAFSPTKIRWNQQRFRQALQHLGGLWPDAEERPRIVWRTLHQVKALRWHPQVWHRQLDAIGRAVVNRLVGESEAAEVGGEEWERWAEERGAEGNGRGAAKQMGLGRRLKGELAKGTSHGLSGVWVGFADRTIGVCAVDEWGTLMQAQINNLRVSPLSPRAATSGAAVATPGRAS